jgi:hypothetical protein
MRKDEAAGEGQAKRAIHAVKKYRGIQPHRPERAYFPTRIAVRESAQGRGLRQRSIPVMAQPFEHWLTELCKRNDRGVLERLRVYVDHELVRVPDKAAERTRIKEEFGRACPDSELKQAMLEIIAA